jgi:hypothetical protein
VREKRESGRERNKKEREKRDREMSSTYARTSCVSRYRVALHGYAKPLVVF